MRLVDFPAALAMIAVGAGCDHVCPDVGTAKVARKHVVNSEAAISAAAVLTCVVIAAEDLPPGESDVWPRPPDLHPQPDHRGPWDQFKNCVNVASPIDHHVGLTTKQEAHCATRRADVNGLEVRIQD